MLGQLLGPVAGLASSWLDAKTTKQAAEAKLKLTEAEAKAKILLSEKTSAADWERIMAENSKILHSKSNNLPYVIILKTVKGKGIKFMERTIKWHHRRFKDNEFSEAVKNLYEV